MRKLLPLAGIVAGLGCLVFLSSNAADDAAAANHAATSATEWIWSDDAVQDHQKAYFRKPFELTDEVSSALLLAVADNHATIYLNDQKVLDSHDWIRPAGTDVTKNLRQGENVLAVEARNDSGPAGLLMQLNLKLKDGSERVISSDGSWMSSDCEQDGWKGPKFASNDWRPAHSFGANGVRPWGRRVVDRLPPAPSATPPDAIRVPAGFAVERLYSVPLQQQGSWVSLTTDNKGRLIASDQSGKLYRITPPALGGDPAETQVEPLAADIGMAQGLCYAFDSLYVSVNGGRWHSGLYRLRDTNGDDQFDEVKLLRNFEGGGEHGPHGIVLAPDGQSLYIIAGNGTKPPKPETSRVPRNWQEDQLLPRVGNWSPVPGGWVARTDPDGKSFELVACGMRNPYDLAFNPQGDLFTYDADMEWDIGTPWYRPTRVCHVTSGSEFGWRQGSGKWPSSYPDSLPPTVNIGVGSPTGITFGTGTKFPEKYQQALFIADWSYGLVYVVHLEPQGASYTATFEQFATGAPFQVTDMVVHREHGALYFAIGGRGSQSGLYRVTYVGDEPTTLVEPKPNAGGAAHALRRRIETLHTSQDAGAIDVAWPHLAHEDRFIRYAARIAIENQPLERWQDRALAEENPTARIQAILALARCGADAALQPKMLEALGRLAWNDLSDWQKLDLLRAYALVFIRTGKPSDAAREVTIARLAPHYPAGTFALNRELSRLLAYLEAPGVVRQTLELLAKAPSQEEQMHYALVLRGLKSDWTLDERRAYFHWFLEAASHRGGGQFNSYMTSIRNEAIASLSEAEKQTLAELLAKTPQPSDPFGEIAARPLVKQWTLEELLPEVEANTTGRNYERGHRMFGAAACYKCHRIRGGGGIVGPDLTGVGRRFSARDLLESIVEPSKNISDQYQAIQILKTDGLALSGRVANASGDTLMIMTNLLEPGHFTNVSTADIEEIVPSTTSMMPNGLLDTLTKEEILDLIAYLRSGGDPNDKAFAKE